jgi:hypothetical protein
MEDGDVYIFVTRFLTAFQLRLLRSARKEAIQMKTVTELFGKSGSGWKWLMEGLYVLSLLGMLFVAFLP